MGKSKNDKKILGFNVRFKMHNTRGKVDYIAKIIDEKTKKPYTNFSVNQAMQSLNDDDLYYLMNKDIIEEIERKAQKYPNADYSITARGSSREEACKNFEDEKKFKLLQLLALLSPDKKDFSYKNALLKDYVLLYMEDMLINEVKTSKNSLKKCINDITSVIGEMEIGEFIGKEKEVRNRIEKFLKKHKFKQTKINNMRKAVRIMFNHINRKIGNSRISVGLLCSTFKSEKNTSKGLKNNLIPYHLDICQRQLLFDYLKLNDLRRLMIIGLIYSGLTFEEIVAVKFKDVEKISFKNGMSMYCIKLFRRARKNGSKYSTISIQNKDYYCNKIRYAVLYKFAADILEQYYNYLKELYTKEEIANMRLSDITPQTNYINYEDLKAEFDDVLEILNKNAEKIFLTDNKGNSVEKDIFFTMDIFTQDAKFVAENICGMDDIKIHAMFGLEQSETDEKSYLDTLSLNYAVIRYILMLKFNPLAVDKDNHKLITLKFKNNTDTEKTLTIISDLGFGAKWKGDDV